jgi:hypothetical protein
VFSFFPPRLEALPNKAANRASEFPRADISPLEVAVSELAKLSPLSLPFGHFLPLEACSRPLLDSL